LEEGNSTKSSVRQRSTLEFANKEEREKEEIVHTARQHNVSTGRKFNGPT